MDEQHALFTRLEGAFPPDAFAGSATETPSHDRGRTLFTQTRGDGSAELRPDRPAFVVSSTSWTMDEDFGILLDALAILDARAVEIPHELPSVVVAVTGKGPQKAAYEAQIRAMKLEAIRICTLWLEPGDYPKLLGSADLGVCLHTSTSGLDLPMKVVDMFGSGIPVCAVGFGCLHELVRDMENGRVFHTSRELAQQLEELLRGFPEDCSELHRLRQRVLEDRRIGWDDNWNRTAFPVFASPPPDHSKGAARALDGRPRSSSRDRRPRGIRRRVHGN